MGVDRPFCYACYKKLNPEEVVWVADIFIQHDYKVPYCAECAPR